MRAQPGYLSVRADKSGTVVKVEAATVARLAQALGAGRSHPKVQSSALAEIREIL